MKGVILAGGSATRLRPLTIATNKHLLALYDKPVIYYPIERLVSAGIDRIMIVTGPEHVGGFVKLLGSGQNFISPKTGEPIQITYGVQNEPNGIAKGLAIAREHVGNDTCILHLGDNIILDDISEAVDSFKTGASVFMTRVKDPERFGIAELGPKHSIKHIIEKPKKPASNFAVIGLYMYDNTVFNRILGLKPSARAEYEITDLNNIYASENQLTYTKLKQKWFDIGTFDSLLEAADFLHKRQLPHHGV